MELLDASTMAVQTPQVSWSQDRSVSKRTSAPGDSPVVFIVDDDVSVRESLEALIRLEGFQVMTYGSAQDFLDQSQPEVPCCLLLDVCMPGLTGLELQKQVSRERRYMPIIFISGQADIPSTVQAMKVGAVEFLTKPLKDEDLLDAIHSAVGRSEVLLAREFELTNLKARFARLTKRERDVMSLVVLGLSNKQIGSELQISEITVKAHRGSMTRKMEADSLADLIYVAARLRLTRRPGSCIPTSSQERPSQASFQSARTAVRGVRTGISEMLKPGDAVTTRGRLGTVSGSTQKTL